MRKASGFPAHTASLLPLGSAGRLSLPAEPRGLVRAEALGKAQPFRTAGGRAALGCHLSGTLTRPWIGIVPVLRAPNQAPNERLTATQGGASLLARNCSLRNLVPVVPRMIRGKREGRENRPRSRHCDRRARSSQSVNRRTATFLLRRKGKAEEEAMTREPGNLPGNYDSA